MDEYLLTLHSVKNFLHESLVKSLESSRILREGINWRIILAPNEPSQSSSTLDYVSRYIKIISSDDDSQYISISLKIYNFYVQWN